MPTPGKRSTAAPHPERGSAVWHLPEGPFPYAEFRVRDDSVAYNTPPGT